MKRQHISGRKLAKAIQKSEKYVRERVAGKIAFDLNDLEQIARVLKLDIILLFTSVERQSDLEPVDKRVSLHVGE